MRLLIYGMHRSGTSMAAGLLSKCGLFAGSGDELISANRWNRKGYFERRDVYQINEGLLRTIGCEWYRTARFDMKRIEPSVRHDFSLLVHNLIKKMDVHEDWLVKDPRLSLLYPLWAEHLDEHACLIVARHPLAVARSLEKRDGFHINFGLALWEHYMVEALNNTPSHLRIVTTFERLLADPLDAIQNISRRIGQITGKTLSLPPEDDLSSFTDASLVSAKSEEQSHEHISVNQLRLYKDIRNNQELRRVSLSEESRSVMDTVEKILEHQQDIDRKKD